MGLPAAAVTSVTRFPIPEIEPQSDAQRLYTWPSAFSHFGREDRKEDLCTDSNIFWPPLLSELASHRLLSNRKLRSASTSEPHPYARTATMTTLLMPALPTATTDRSGLQTVSSSALDRGFTALHAFSAMWITDTMFTTAIAARYRVAAITPTHQGVSIKSIISEEMRCEMDVATSAAADARQDTAHLLSKRPAMSRVECQEESGK
jgi:hypothetical protein